jgi:archaeal flagellin FlaB
LGIGHDNIQRIQLYSGRLNISVTIPDRLHRQMPDGFRNLKVPMKSSRREDRAFSGIEAAIVLIAFVVVGSVFSYVVLGTSFFTVQKSKQISQSSITQTASKIVVHGDVIGLDTSGAGNISILEFDLALPEGGLPIDVSTISIIFSTGNQPPIRLKYIPSSGAASPPSYGLEPGSWTIISSTMSPGTTVMKNVQRATIALRLPKPLQSREDFNVQLEAENGALLGISRTVPLGVTNTTILY